MVRRLAARIERTAVERLPGSGRSETTARIDPSVLEHGSLLHGIRSHEASTDGAKTGLSTRTLPRISPNVGRARLGLEEGARAAELGAEADDCALYADEGGGARARLRLPR